MIDRIDQQLKVQRVALGVLTHRQELLALAGRRSADVGMMATSPRHLGGTSGSSFAGAAKYRTEFQPSVDGNTVNMDVERSAFAQNALRLEAALTFINSDFKSLQMAMSQ